MKNVLLKIFVFIFVWSAWLILPIRAETTKITMPHPIVNQSICTKQPKSIDELVGNFDKQIKIIFSDIDGTLVPLDKKMTRANSPESTKQAVKLLKAAHIPLILATGRPFIEAKEFADKMGCREGYIITQQGADIRTFQGKVIYQSTMSSQDTKKIINEFSKLKNSNNLTSKMVVFINGKPYSTDNFKLPYNWAKIKLLNSYDDLGEKITPSTICIYEPNPEKLRLIQAELQKIFCDFHVVLSTDCYCEIASPKTTKATAIKKMSEFLSIDLKNAATFGDAENDISMLKEVKDAGGLAITVGNAMPILKSHSNYVTDSVYDGGVLKAVKKILENNKRLEILIGG